MRLARCFVSLYLFVLASLLVSCATLGPSVQSQSPVAAAKTETNDRFLTFDKSNAMMIDKAVAGLRLADSISGHVSTAEKVVVVSMESPQTRSDTKYDYLVNDGFTADLFRTGYSLLEREENLLLRSGPEQAEPYNRSLLRPLPSPPIIALLDVLERKGIDSVLQSDKAPLLDIIAFYRQLQDDYQSLLSQLDHLKSADVLVSYRLLELGVRYDTDKTELESQNVGFSNGDPFSQKKWTLKISRHALARIFVRVVDAKTGEIRYASPLQNEISDAIILTQEDKENERDFAARVDGLLSYLSSYHYIWFEQDVPNKNAPAEQNPRN
jgi:hypothetical protein